jgi:hypothetical protein
MRRSFVPVPFFILIGLAACLKDGTGPSTAEPRITGISPEVLSPGTEAIITGANLGADPGASTVTIAGVAATVLQASPSRLVVEVPAPSECGPARRSAVAVTVGSRSTSVEHPLASATSRTLGVGESAVVLDPRQLRCNALVGSGGRYVISVYNPGAAVASLTAFRLRGIGATGSQSSAPVVPAPLGLSSSPLSGPAGIFRLGVRRNEELHTRMLEEDRQLFARLGPPPRVDRTDVSRSAAAAPPPTVGTVRELKLPAGGTDRCTNYRTVRARVVYSGTRLVILEDVKAPLATRMDGLYAALGREFDAEMFGIMGEYFGNPLARDAVSDNDGRVHALFSPLVNETDLGYVSVSDLYPASHCPGSNDAEIFYMSVPTDPGSGFEGDTRESWMWTIRSIMVHEAKHVASFAERVTRNATRLDDVWLEEATARMAEEIWARRHFDYRQHGNRGYASGVRCEVRPAVPGACLGKPLVMYRHFDALYRYLEAVGSRSPLGRSDADDETFYGSGWSLLRWAIDHYGSSEAAFLRAVTQETTRGGAASLEARTGKRFEEMLGEWSLANAVDDYPGFTPKRSTLSHPSWNTRDIFRGLRDEYPEDFSREFPLAMPRLAPGSFTVDVTALRGGTASLFELSGAFAGPQIIELTDPAGGAPPSSLRVAIVRVQ